MPLVIKLVIYEEHRIPSVAERNESAEDISDLDVNGEAVLDAAQFLVVAQVHAPLFSRRHDPADTQEQPTQPSSPIRFSAASRRHGWLLVHRWLAGWLVGSHHSMFSSVVRFWWIAWIAYRAAVRICRPQGEEQKEEESAGQLSR
jgi:hypothetical protein